VKEQLLEFAPLFMGLTEAERDVLAAGFVEGQAPANSALFNAGSNADSMLLIGKGFVRVTNDQGHVLATLGPGSIVGDAALFRGATHDVAATAVSDVEFWRLGDRKLRDLLIQNPSIGMKLSQNFGSQIAQMEDYLVQRLGRTKELAGLPVNTLQAVAGQLRPRALAANQALFRAGEAPAGLYFVESGALDLRPDTTSAGEEAQRVGQSAVLGALALLMNKPQTQTALAVEDSLLWTLSADSFHAINSRHPGLRRSLARSVRARLGRADQAQAVMRLTQMPIFAEVPPNVVQAMAQRMVVQHVPAGDRVYRIGEAGDALYLVEQGEVELTAENAMGVIEEKARVGAGNFFGEMSVLTSQVRTEDATATRNTNLWVLYKADLDALAAQHPALGKALSQAIATRLATSDTTSADDSRFRNFPLLAGLSTTELHQVATYLKPSRYRAGEQIFRVNTPGDMLYLLERGRVRIQPLSGGNWLLGPGEEFGERALLGTQPHNASATAETDVDVWTLNKNDFNTLMNQYPNLAINLSRILNQRLGGPNQDFTDAPAPMPYQQGGPAALTGGNARRRQAANAPQQPFRPQRQGFGAWFGNLSLGRKLLIVVLILLLLWLMFIAVPWTILRLQGLARWISGAEMAGSPDAVEAVYAMGSYNVAALDEEAARAIALADQQVPPTPTWTPFPTPTPLITPTPVAIPRVVAPMMQYSTELLQLGAPQPGAPAGPAPEAPAPDGAVQPAAVVAPPRNLDSRLNALGVSIEDAQVAPGQQYWRVVEARFADEQESAGKHHIYVDVMDENGNRIVGQPVTVMWGDGNFTGPVEDKAAPDFGFNYMMYASGYAYNVKVEGLPSDVLRGAGMGDIANRFRGIHTSYYVVFQRATK
jgi:CRP-like cAMP-binding protein